MKPLLGRLFAAPNFSKKVGSIQWLQSAFFRRPPMALADAHVSSEVRFAPELVNQVLLTQMCECRTIKEEGARRRPLNSNRLMQDQAAINGGLDFRR
jgi:hypothetical protein